MTKWSDGGKAGLKRRRRLQFIEAINRNYEDIDFSVHCISSTEGEISRFAQMFYMENLDKITQELDDKNRNCLVFKINEARKIKFPVPRAAVLIWICYVIKYMKEANQLDGFIYSDWFSGRGGRGGEGIVNFLLKATGIDLQINIEHDPAEAEADLLSDWFVGWSNSSKNGTADEDIKAEFDKMIERTPEKIGWIMYGCNPEIVLEGSATTLADELRNIGFLVKKQ